MKNYKLINKQQIEDPDFDWGEYLDNISKEEEVALISALTKEELESRKNAIIEYAVEVSDWDDYEYGEEIDWPCYEYSDAMEFNCGWSVYRFGSCILYAGDEIDLDSIEIDDIIAEEPRFPKN